MNEYICQIKPSASMELMQKAAILKANGENIISLAGGEPDFDTPNRIKDVVYEQIRNGNTHYAVGKGNQRLRERICEKLYIDNQMVVNPDNIIVTPGSKMAIYLAVRACINIGDEVIIPKPSWVSYEEIVVAAGGVPVTLELSEETNYSLTEELLMKCTSSKTKMLILNSPNNPTGHVMSEQEIGEIVKYLSDNQVYVISDEVYEKIVYSGKKNISLASVNEIEDYIITVNGFSKAYAMTGWRVGYVTANSNIINTMNYLFSHTITGVSPFIQEAAIEALECQNEVEEMRIIYQQRRDFFVKALNEINGVKVNNPDGAFYAWTRIDYKKMNSNELAEHLLEKAKVVCVPGTAYNNQDINHVRFSFANSMEELKEAVMRVGETLV